MPCVYRCKHCDFAPVSGFKTLDINKIIEITDELISGTNKKNYNFKNYSVHLGDCALNHPDLPCWISYLKDRNIEGWRSIAVDGFVHKPVQQWQPVLISILERGTEFLEFTLYGEGKTHDWFAGKKRSYESILALADLWQSLGGKTIWNLFVHKKNLQQIRNVQTEISTRFKTCIDLSLWSYVGFGTEIEQLRLDVDDMEFFDENYKDQFESYKPEYKWIDELKESDEMPYPLEPKIVRIVVDSSLNVRMPYTRTGLGHQGIVISKYGSESGEMIIDKWFQEYQRIYSSYPNIKKLIEKCGDLKSSKLHSKSSIISKWLSLFQDYSK
ncbi:MAG: hypothetical protein APR63_10450 [Desulfuromonas sp. SDB]|nr:MAG: hypothetical protein APR63_10450 [Desulfuromonas sp. SDB]